MTPRSGWFALGLADDLERGTSTGARLFGREMVVWRDDAGQSHVWEDRCPHRGTRLSFGFVRGNHIACLYHGWQFDVAGRCRYIPAHPKLEVAATIGVERFASVERLGFIWMFSGEDAAGTTAPGGDAETTPIRSLSVSAPVDRVLALLQSSSPPLGDGGSVATGLAGPLLTFAADGRRLHVAVQPTSPAETMMHIVLESGAGADRASISLWAQALRRDMEAARGPVGVSA